MDLIADTTFLVGLWRKQPWALDFARHHRQRVLGIPWVVAGEFWHGALRAKHDEELVRKFLGMGMPLTDVTRVVPVYAALSCQVQEDGFLGQIGQNDLWIAAAALSHGLPLVTRNRRHFDKIRGLRLEVLCTENPPGS